jgi:SprT protein
MHSRPQGKEALEKHLPPRSCPVIFPLLENYNVRIKIAGGRKTKFGDFNSSPKKGNVPVISVNSNMNTFFFLITLLHELAHFLVWNDGHFHAKPHGRTWKLHFSRLMNEMISHNIFPDELLPSLNKHLLNPKATSCSDAFLFKKLSQYDIEKPGMYIDDLPDDTMFETPNGDIFKKIKKVRTRSLCKQLHSGRKYLFSPVYRVIPIKDKQYIMVFPLFFIFLPDQKTKEAFKYRF